ncbi:VOC family protein [Mariniflexile litorale]|uniref:VOC family protein n=1 Tax=Mariniflexile litorale TaxID=3045158 RepID=A0AAU7EBN9_9FLAO|nr:VOC family protein [Mariniflexile sp. KMM 9835]MDQ8213033.1 VOC family protein [Mariniflexile sp. KMM 9835]
MENQTKLKGGLNTLALYNVAFVVSNIEESIKWYNNILGFKLVMKQAIPLEKGELQMAFMEGAGMKIEMLQNSDNQLIDAIVNDSKVDAPPTVVGSKALVFQVEDLKKATKELEEKHVKFLWKERYLAEGALFCTMALDPDGNRINIFQANTVIQ